MGAKTFLKLTEVIVDAHGITHDARDVCPTTLARLMEQDIDDHLADVEAKSARYMGLGGRPWLSPIKELVNRLPSASWTGQHQGFLKATSSGGVWTQQRFFQAGLVAHDLCTCGEVGSLHHRAFSCPFSRNFRNEYGMPDAILNMASTRPQLHLWTHALMMDPRCWVPPPLLAAEPVWEIRPPDGFFSGTCYGDGSTMLGNDFVRARSGYAVVQCEILAATMRVVGALFGALPGRLQCTPAAELFGLLMFLTHTDGINAVYKTDCKWVHDGVAKGEEHTTGPQHAHADLWRRVWQKIRDIGRGAISVVKVKAHATNRQVEAGAVTKEDQLANQFADEYAKKGFKVHPANDAANQRCQKTRWVQQVVAKYLARLHFKMRSDGLDTEGPTLEHLRALDNTRRRRAEAGQLVIDQHVVCNVVGRFRCMLCMRSSQTEDILRRAPCAGSNGHVICVAGPFHFCASCGAYSKEASRLLLGPCRGQLQLQKSPWHKKALSRLRLGVCPITGEYVGTAVPLQSLLDLFLDEITVKFRIMGKQPSMRLQGSR